MQQKRSESARTVLYKSDHYPPQSYICESRRDEEEGGELDSQDEASPEEIKSREVVLVYRERVGLLLQLFPNRSYGHRLCDSVLQSCWDNNERLCWLEHCTAQIGPAPPG